MRYQGPDGFHFRPLPDQASALIVFPLHPEGNRCPKNAQPNFILDNSDSWNRTWSGWDDSFPRRRQWVCAACAWSSVFVSRLSALREPTHLEPLTKTRLVGCPTASEPA